MARQKRRGPKGLLNTLLGLDGKIPKKQEGRVSVGAVGKREQLWGLKQDRVEHLIPPYTKKAFLKSSLIMRWQERPGSMNSSLGPQCSSETKLVWEQERPHFMENPSAKTFRGQPM